MGAKKQYYVYILTNRSGTLYVGVTNDIHRRVHEHQTTHPESFTAKYHLDRVVYVESTSDVQTALAREKQLKGWTRRKKLALIQQQNPTWNNLTSQHPT